jgi:hypothetical protein
VYVCNIKVHNPEKNVAVVIKVVSKENAVWQFQRGIVPLKFLRKSLTANQNQM